MTGGDAAGARRRSPVRPLVRKVAGRWLVVHHPGPHLVVVLTEQATLPRAHQWAEQWACWAGERILRAVTTG